LCNSINIIQTKFFLHTNKSFTIKPYIYLSIFIASIMSIRWRIMFSNFLHTVRGKDLAISFSKMAMYPHDILSVCYMPNYLSPSKRLGMQVFYSDIIVFLCCRPSLCLLASICNIHIHRMVHLTAHFFPLWHWIMP
jgi:hypothetical protein